MQLADALVTCLRDLDLRYLFGVSGANIEHLHDAVHRLGGNKFRTVMTKSEYGAAFMADTRARVHRTLGVCCSTSGGGMMNLAVGIAESYAQQVPVLAIVGQPPISQEGRGAFQDSSGKAGTVNAEQMWAALSKYVCKITRAEDFWPQFKQALLQPLEGRPGPAVMLIPRDMITAEVGDIPEDFPQVLPTIANTAKRLLSVASATGIDCSLLAIPVEAQLENLWNALAHASKPLLIIGSGVVREGSEALAIEFAHATGMRVATTLACVNAFPQHSLQYIGMIGAAGHASAHDFLENEADLILAIGTELRAMNRATLERSLQRKPLHVINTHLEQLDPDLCSTSAIVLDTKLALTALLKWQEKYPLQFNTPQLVAQSDITRDPAARPVSPGECGVISYKLSQKQALQVLEPHLPHCKHVLFDAGNCAAFAAHYLRLPTGVSTTIALGMGGMGYAIAGAIGAQMGEEAGHRTLVIGGDGAFMMAGFEIHTAVDLRLPILWVIFNNNQHGMCVTRQQLYFDGRIEGNTYSPVHIARIASGLGSDADLWVGCARNAKEMHSALVDYFALSPRTGVLELKIDDESLPPFRPFLQARAADRMETP